MEQGKDIFDEMAEAWPGLWIPRPKLPEATGYLMTPSYAANLDSRGEGPPGRFRIGRQVVYPKKQLFDWLRARSSFSCEKAS